MSDISEFEMIMNGFDFTPLFDLLLRVIPALICISLHELSHGLMAYFLGDNTAKEKGRLSLNPLKHIDPVGFLMMLVFRYGWAKPVPVNMYNFRNPKHGMALTALAGPLCNVLLSLIFFFLYGVLYIPLENAVIGSYILRIFEASAYLSIGLAVFNLLPIPPLDGSKIVLSILSDEGYVKLMRYERFGGIALLALAFSGLLGKPLSAAIYFSFDKLFFFAELGFQLYIKLFV